jgi:hypothetical protein
VTEVDDLLGDTQLELSEMLSHILDKGVVLRGEVMLAVADIDLIKLDLGLLLTGVETALRRRSRAQEIAPPPVDVREAPDMDAGEAVRALHAPVDAPIAPLAEVAEGLPPRLNTDPEKVENGLAKLVLTLIEVLRKVLEHQAVRRMEGGHLSEAEVEKLGVALLRLNDRMQEMKETFGLTDEDLQIDLGPLGKLR